MCTIVEEEFVLVMGNGGIIWRWDLIPTQEWDVRWSDRIENDQCTNGATDITPPCSEEVDTPMADKNSSRLRLVSTASSSTLSSLLTPSLDFLFPVSAEIRSSSCCSFCWCSLAYLEDPLLCFDHGRYSAAPDDD